ncbi:ATP-binding cassette domain-containing protein [Corynebacterium hindlerae]|uniref:ATP-binding cassette domain-containing protein n=1 Tax=Corynebacterium hindlerae TaxID=699041 RepID=A0A7G5FDH0_9CORY|nr:ATP-binding cassette domain-containing protein [Corynebacterium hindlerae]QMV84661.1 ATP-binding cassette domain-containing protein [Corynebacterium hindlerae]
MASPLDRRLLVAAPAARRHIIVTGLAQAVDTALTVARAVLIGVAVASLVEQQVTRWDLVAWLVAVVVAQSGVAWVARRWASLSIGEAVDELREAALVALAHRDPRDVEEDAAQWRETLTAGLAGVRPYLSDYVPALIAACLSTPIALAVMLYFDLTSGLLATTTLPLIPLFMVLIGTLTRSHTEKRLQVAGKLSGQLSDLLQGSATLRAFGVTETPHAQLVRTGSSHATATMSVLRLAFLSAFALEFLATLSVALIAVSIGLRLVAGDMTLLAGLVALIIAPEVYTPLRRVGSSFHAAVDGITAAQRVFELVSESRALTASYRRAGNRIDVRQLSVTGRDGIRPNNLSFTARPGTITVLRGANGSGKSTALLAILGLLPDDVVDGEIIAPPLSLISYLPAHPAFEPGTVSSNLALLGARAHELSIAAERVGLDVPATHPVGASGTGISAGQGQRLALARVIANSERTTLLLDEPSAHLSPELVSRLTAQLQDLAEEGRTIVISSHDPRVVSLADQVIDL